MKTFKRHLFAKVIQHKTLLKWTCAVSICLLLFFCLIAYFYGNELLPIAKDNTLNCWEYLKTCNPVYFYVAFAIAPIFPIPVTPFLLVAPALHGLSVAMLGVGIAYCVNLILTYKLYNGIARPLARRILHAIGYNTPTVSKANEGRIVTLIRVTPVFPFCIQNLILGLSGVSFLKYLLISWLIIFIDSCAILVLGESITKGSGNYAFFGISLLIAITVMVKILRSKSSSNGETLETFITEVDSNESNKTH